jgi:site-specific recombinase XerD
LRDRIPYKHYSICTEQAYVQWIRRFIQFHGLRHPQELGARDASAYLTHLAVQGRVAAATQNQAKSALLFLYREVLELTLPWLDDVESAKQPQRLPVVLSVREMDALLHRLSASRASSVSCFTALACD